MQWCMCLDGRCVIQLINGRFTVFYMDLKIRLKTDTIICLACFALESHYLAESLVSSVRLGLLD